MYAQEIISKAHSQQSLSQDTATMAATTVANVTMSKTAIKKANAIKKVMLMLANEDKSAEARIASATKALSRMLNTLEGNGPKRDKTGYNLFIQSTVEKLRKKNKDLPQKQAMSEAAALWRTASEHKKALWNAKARKLTMSSDSEESD